VARFKPLLAAFAVSGVSTIAVFGVLAGGGAIASKPNGSSGGRAPVGPAVLNELATDGEADFWLVLRHKADLTDAYEIRDWEERGQYVYDQLRSTAKESQADLLRKLQSEGIEFQSFWIANRVLVRDGSPATLDVARSQSEVDSIRAAHTYDAPEPVNEPGGAALRAVEWGLTNIHADAVWSRYGVRGQGSVVGNIDTGVQFDHPALVSQYRGSRGDGTFDHNYNWYDPENVCPSLVPCDNNGHGTATMGTMVGDDGAGNQIGVAPGARWIAAKACASSTCSDAALLAAGQWMLAPTDLSGQNPRPDLRPHVINNAWSTPNGSGSAVDPVYRATVTAWTAAGIFGVFANGNSGPACDTTESPADNVEAWGVGAYDISNSIASFSSRGPGEGGEIRPNISAPGVNVRSSLPGGGYGSFSGTSMAAAHQSGAVALMWSAAPTLRGDIAQTRQILDNTAVDVDATACGGTADDNNVFGEGRLDVLAAVNASVPEVELSIDDVSITEGDSGQATATLTVTLSAPSGQDVSFGYATADGTATAPADYAQASGSKTISTGSTTTTIDVPVNGDTLDEPDETFTVDLANPSGATISDATGEVTIIDDDADTTPPETVIDSGPPASAQTKSATFTFSSNESPVVFECQIDGEGFAACTSPKTVHVKKGQHIFQVRAIDAHLNVDLTPASWTWTVKPKA
jgi:hypothetical protein